MGTSKGTVGEIVEIRRSDAELSVEWEIPRFLSLSCDCLDHFESPLFFFYGVRWYMRVWPYHWTSPEPVSTSFCIDSSCKVVTVAVGVRGSGGVEKRRRAEEREFTRDNDWYLQDFISRSELRGQKHRLMPADVLTIACEMKIPCYTGRVKSGIQVDGRRFLPYQCFLGRIGTICKLEKKSETLSFQWQIRNFFSLSGKGSDYYASPDFVFGGANWCLLMLSNGQAKNSPTGCLGLFLKRNDSGPRMSIRHSLCISGAEGVEKVKEGVCEFSAHSSSKGWPDFFPRDVLKNHQKLLIPNGVFTITCSMERGAVRGIFSNQDSASQTDGEFRESNARSQLNKQDASIQTNEDFKQAKFLAEENHSSEKQGLEKVVEDWGKLLASGESSDVTAQVGDEEFRVHWPILCARSPVLSAMFRHESRERASSRIVIEDCEQDAFREYLRHLYAGSVRPLAEGDAFSLYSIADKYLSDDLKQLCLEHIRDTLSVRTFCDVVQLALTHGESDLLDRAMGFAAGNIRSIIRTVEWQTFNRDHPTEATQILIKSLGPPS